MKQQHGEFSITSISYINNCVTAITSGAYKNASNQEMVELVDKIKQDKNDDGLCFESYFALAKDYSVEEIKEFSRSALLNNKSIYIQYLMKKIEKMGFSNIGTAVYVTNLEEYKDIDYIYLGNLLLPINFGFVYIMLAVAITYLLYNLIKNRSIDWVVAFCSVLILANLFTLIVGAPFEFQRLFFSSIALVLLLIGKCFDNFKIDNKIKEKEVK